jgi:uncharacterized protein YkwD
MLPGAILLACLAFGCGQKRGGTPPPRPTGPLGIDAARAYMLALVNADREREGLAPVEVDDVATRAAQRHADDMVRNGYRAHWGTDGSVPEQRYTEAGGEHLVHENVTCFIDGKQRELAIEPTFSAEELEAAQRTYMDEKPPNDGHRLNILIPTHNRLGVGLAKAEGLPNVCLAQEFVDAYGDYDALPQVARAGERIVVAGRVHEPAAFGAVGIAKGPLPAELYPSDLNSTSTYTMPEPYATYFPRGFVTPREVAVEGGRFSIALALDRGPGRYAVSVWGRFPQAGGNAPPNELGMLSLRTILVR